MTDAPTPDPEPAGYAEAVRELDAILVEIEAPDVDVDVLGDKVARAAALIEWCRARIVRAEAAVEDATRTLGGPEPD